MSSAISAEEHRLRGTRPTRAKPEEPSKFSTGRPKKPAHLSPLAEVEWKRVTKLLAKRGTLTAADAPALEVYAETYARWRSFLDEIRQHGAMVEESFLDKHGEVFTRGVKNPCCALALQCENSMRQFQKEFGITPASREVTKPAAPDPNKKVPVYRSNCHLFNS